MTFRSALYPIVDPAGHPQRDHVSLAAAILAGGAPLIQLRAKTMPTGEFVVVARKLRELTRAAGAILIINDRVDIAKLVGADGAHLGQNDLDVASARRILGADAVIGLSTHDLEQARAAQASTANYIGFGPIYATATKADTEPVQGLEQLRLVCGESALPVVAIGGINSANAAGVLQCGAAAVAMISAISHSADPQRQVADLICRLRL